MIGKLKALTVARAKTPGLINDGDGLYLNVAKSGTKSWIFRYWAGARDPATGEPARDQQTGKALGRSREMGLGSTATITLEQARKLAAECRRLRSEGLDPIEVKRARKTKAALDAAKAITFTEAAERYFEAHSAGWRSAKHAFQWKASLRTYVEPIIGALPIQAIDTALVCKVLEPIWSAKPETAARVRGRIEVVIDWAKARGYRTGENPARWRGHLDKLLPGLSDLQKNKPIKHHAALP
jgi:hypothetical protein